MSSGDTPESRKNHAPSGDPNPQAGPLPRVSVPGRRTRRDERPATGQTGAGQPDTAPATQAARAPLPGPAPIPVVHGPQRQAPRTPDVLPSGSAALPGSPDDRSKTEPSWEDAPPAPALTAVVPGINAPATPGDDAEHPPTARLPGGALADQAASALAAPAPSAPPAPAPVPPAPAPSAPAPAPTGSAPASPAPATPAPTAPAPAAPVPAVPGPGSGMARPQTPGKPRRNGRPHRPAGKPTAASRAGTRPAAPGTGTTPTIPIDPAVARTGAHPTVRARRMLHKLMQSEAPPTQAFSIVDRLVGSPYANPMIQVPAQDASARKTLEFALDLAETMFRYGAGALEVETSIIAVTASLGLRHVDVDITNQSIHLNYAPADQTPVSILRVVRSWTDNYAGLALVHQLVSDIIAGGVTRQQAVDRLSEITHRPKPFPRWMVNASGGGFATMFVMFIGGSWQGALVAFLSWQVVAQVTKLAGRWRVPEFFAVALGSFVVTAIAMLLWAVDVPLSPAIVVAGGIMLLLPSSRFVSSVQDAINGFPVTAAGRFFSALIIYAAIVSGIMTALVIGSLLGARELDVTRIDQIAYPLWLLVVFVVAAVLFGAVFVQTARGLLLPTAAVALVGYLAYLGAQWAGVGDRLTPAIAAVVVGAAGRWTALRSGAPQLVVAVPAVVFLLPGLMIFRAMYGIAIDSGDITSGLVELFNASTIIMAIAGGIVLGDTVARPLTKGWASHERRRIRRR